ncbi:MAG: TPM domain-containing protein [Desulfuromonadales bacterium]|nr:TPM domain-containing protein [Desulfuromonadales bacterium]MBN2792618.1 TPM domain-containing protein [Desulfuromonadales bacterium]
MVRLFTTLILILVFAAPVASLEVPRPTGYVNDKAHLLSQTVELKLEQFLREFENSDSTQITVLTIPTLDGETLEDYTLKVFEDWKIGQLDKDNGALLLIAKTERKIRIEVGYGLEGRLTDLLAGRIIDREISPKFKQGDYDGGIISGVLAMAEAVRGEYAGSGSKTNQKKKGSPFGLIFLLFFLGPFLSRITGRSSGRYRRSGIFFGGPFIGGGGFGSGGFGGGGFSGGGGGSGGGGASGGW